MDWKKRPSARWVSGECERVNVVDMCMFGMDAVCVLFDVSAVCELFDVNAVCAMFDVSAVYGLFDVNAVCDDGDGTTKQQSSEAG